MTARIFGRTSGMFREGGRWIAALALAVFVVASGKPARASDAGVFFDGGHSAADEDGGSPPSSSSTRAIEAELGRLGKEVSDLGSLGRGGPLEHFPVAALFEVDLLDEEAIVRRIQVLRSRSESRARSSTTSAALDSPGLSLDAAGGLSEVADAKLSGESADQRDALISERDRLRLAFLERPRSDREAAIDRERARQRLKDERERADRERAAAMEAERKAEIERQQALEAARLAEGAAKRAIAAERARVAAERAALATTRRDQAEARQLGVSDEAKRRGVLDELLRRAGDREISSSEADRLYDEIVADLSKRREALAGLLDQLGHTVSQHDFRIEIDLDAPEYATLSRERDALIADAAALEEEAAEIEGDKHERMYASVTGAVAEISSLNELRISLLERLSDEKRGDVLGLTRAGLAQLEREMGHVRLMARWYPRAKLASFARLPSLLEDTFTVGRMSLKTFGALLLVAGVVVARRRHKTWIEKCRAFALGMTKKRALRLWLDRWLRAVAAIAGPGLFLIVAYLFLDGIVEPEEGSELGVLRDVVIAFSWYRLASAATHHALTAAAAREVGVVSKAVSDKILRSVHAGGRFVLAVYAFLVVSGAILGKGYLYRVVITSAWLGALPIAYLLLRWWRGDIAAVYLRAHPSGALASLVDRTRDRASGIFIVAAAFAFVAARGGAAYARGMLLGFEQTRKALAFVFRKRLERQRENSAGTDEGAAALPDVLLRAFGEGPAEPAFALARYPRLDEIETMMRAYREGARGGAAVVLVGEQGVGKTWWLEELARRASPPLAVRAIEHRITTESEVGSMLCEVLSMEKLTTSRDLVRRLAGGGPRVVLLDMCQNLVLRAVGGMEGYRAFSEIVSGTSDRIFWICAFAKRPFEFVRRVEVGRDIFHTTVELPAWTEAEIGELIDRRMSTTGFVASYEDLIVERLEGTEFSTEVLRTAGSYRRLLWDYADGNPRVAIHFWLRSLVPEGDRRVRVRLFTAPEVERLEGLRERTRFVLAALVQHESITAAEASRFLRYPVAECESTLAFLNQEGYLVEKDGRHRLTTRWYRAILRFLRRKNLLFT